MDRHGDGINRYEFAASGSADVPRAPSGSVRVAIRRAFLVPILDTVDRSVSHQGRIWNVSQCGKDETADLKRRTLGQEQSDRAT